MPRKPRDANSVPRIGRFPQRWLSLSLNVRHASQTGQTGPFWAEICDWIFAEIPVDRLWGSEYRPRPLLSPTSPIETKPADRFPSQREVFRSP